MLVSLLVRGWFAARFDPLADEAYHWVWSTTPAFGYFDQPPMVAWGDRLGVGVLGRTPLGLRWPGLLAGALAVLGLLPFARDRGLLVRWLVGLPPLAWLGALAVPDAWLLAWWSAALGCALRGGPAWVLAGLFGAFAALSKHDGIAVFACCLLAADPAERRTPWPWLGAAVGGVVLAPHAVWLAQHDLVTVRFQLAEGLVNARPPGLVGPLRVLGEQAALLGLGAPAVVAAWWTARPADRIDRLALAASLPVFLFFALAAIGGPPEAHWPAPAWIGAGLLVSRASGRVWRLGSLASWLGVATSLLLAVQVERPLTRLPRDPGARFGEGRVLADAVALRALPLGVAAWEPAASQVRGVVAERYQEAAAIRWFTGIPATVFPGCGRPSEYDAHPVGLPADLWFVRPATHGPPDCVLRATPVREVVDRQRVRGVDAREREVGPWDVLRLGAAP